MQVRDLVRTFFEDVFTHGRTDVCAQIVAPRYLEHALAPFGEQEPGDVPGPEHVAATAAWLREQFPDLRMEIEEVVSEGDLVAVLVRTEGTNLGKLNGVVPPTGRPFSSRQSHWFRVQDGLLTEHWATRDDLTTMLQLGLVPRPGGPPRP
jgi:predicted SnoaL-like aldol condensation-catalyzing enzyme